jgi:uncharacterized membrane protein
MHMILVYDTISTIHSIIYRYINHNIFSVYRISMHDTTLLSPLSLLITVPPQIFVYVACIILPMVLSLWLVLGIIPFIRATD